ncbi:MAG: malonic semialdehyde reductase [Betaproteobacteria bacterium]|nr:malonic semialdehyde reductase [Betaproteobacteria bacterium]
MSHPPLDDAALDQLFRTARTAHGFLPQPLPPGTAERLFELTEWGPTAFNALPARFVFIQSPAGKARLKPVLSPGNVAQTMAAPLTVIVAYDLQFHEHLPQLFRAYDAAPLYRDKPEVAEPVAFRNSTLQGAYLIMAARALGLDAGPMSGFNAAALNREFFPDGRCKANFLVNIGVADPAASAARDARLSFAQAATVL